MMYFVTLIGKFETWNIICDIDIEKLKQNKRSFVVVFSSGKNGYTSVSKKCTLVP